MLDDKYPELDKIFQEQIEAIKKASHEELVDFCVINEIDYNNKTDEELVKELIELYEDEN